MLNVVLITDFGGYCQAMPPIKSIVFPKALDYTKHESWLVKPKNPKLAVDVFFVYPTVLFNKTDWLMDISKKDMRLAALRTIKTQCSVFEGQANIYAPMYRQMNIASLKLSKEDATPLHKISQNDVWRAFKYYLKYENNGRPFFLAAHSQGSMILANIMLEHWGFTGAEDRLIAAYLLGWSLTSKELATNSAIYMCNSSDQIGCVISYNCVENGKQSISPTIKKGAIAVNPLSWTTNGTFVPADKNLGSVFFDLDGKQKIYPHFTSAQIVNGGVVVQPKDEKLVTVKNALFPKGIYHAFDYSIFFMNIKTNIAERIKAFKQKI